MATMLSRGLCLAVLLLSAMAVRADEDKDKDKDKNEIDTDNLFGFVVGTDVGERGEREFESETEGRLGKSDGFYSAVSQTFQAQFTPLENLQLTPSVAFVAHDISSVPDLNDRNQIALQALAFEMKYRLLDRQHAPFGLAIDVEPQWGFVDETSGEPADQYGVDLTLAFDKELVPNRVVAAFNLLYQPETTRFHATDMWQHESAFGVAAGLMAQVRPGILVGAEARYLRKYDGLALDSFSGHALFLGPTVFVQLSEQSHLSVSWSVQVAGRSTDVQALSISSTSSATRSNFSLASISEDFSSPSPSAAPIP
jgi:hypothetical protein